MIAFLFHAFHCLEGGHLSSSWQGTTSHLFARRSLSLNRYEEKINKLLAHSILESHPNSPH